MTDKAKKLFSSGEVSGADVRSMVEERSSVKKKRHTGSTDFKFLNPESCDFFHINRNNVRENYTSS